MVNKNSESYLVTGECRLSYVHLTRPYKQDGQQDEKYKVTLLIPKRDTATKNRIDACIEAAIRKGMSEYWGNQRPSADALNLPIYDGDGVRPSDKEPYSSEHNDHWVMTASCGTLRKPEVVDMQGNPIINESEIYSGMYGNVSIEFFPYNKGRRGVGCALGNVRKTRDGEQLAGGTTAADDFAGMQGAAQTPMPQQPQYPAAGQAPAYQSPQYPMAAQPPAYQQPYYPAVGTAAMPAINPITGLPVA